VPIESQSTTSC